MTVSTTSSQLTVGLTGATNVFAFPFIGVSASDIEIIYTDSDGAETSIPTYAYSVALNSPVTGQIWGVGGTVTYPLSGPFLLSGSLTISRILPLTQEAELSNQGNQYPIVTEEALDTCVMQTQQVAARTGKLRGSWLPDTIYSYSDVVVDGANGNDTGNLYSCAQSYTSTSSWANDLAAGYWSLALNVQGIINTLPALPDNTVYGNISGMTATPSAVGVSDLIDSAIGNTQGAIFYRSGSQWTVLDPGTNGQFLETQGASANPKWVSASGSGTVTEIDTGTGLTGGPITGSGAVSLATVADGSLLANLSGGTLAPGATTLSALLDYVLGNTQGSIIYRGASIWADLTPGTAGQILETGGASANPSWYGARSISSNNGYVDLPFGIILQWGNTGSLSAGAHTITLNSPNITFPNNFFGVVAISQTADSTATSNNYAVPATTNTFTMGNKQSTNATFFWMAIGN